MFGPDGRLYACANEIMQIMAYSNDGQVHTIAENVSSNDLVVNETGVYFSDPKNQRIYHVPVDGELTNQPTEAAFPNGVALSPDHTLLYAADMRGQFVYSYQIQPDGSLAYEQPFFHLHVGPGQTSSGADGMTVDTEGRLYVATQLGLQICDQPGRVHLILPKPQPAWLSNVVFGGPQLDTLFVTCGDKIYKRKVKAQGVAPGRGPTKPPRPRL